jgi:hypothetical protein
MSLTPFAEKITIVTAASGPSELLAAEPPVLTNIRMGYARVSTGGQKLEHQLDALKAAGCRRIFAEKQSGRDTDRPELAACLDFMHAGDTLVVPSLDRLSRSLQDLITAVGNLRCRGSASPPCVRPSTPPPPAAGWSSTSSPPSPNSSAN